MKRWFIVASAVGVAMTVFAVTWLYFMSITPVWVDVALMGLFLMLLGFGVRHSFAIEEYKRHYPAS